MSTVLELEDVVRRYPVGARTLTAVDGVSLRIEAGETYALVGESGCGKSTLARIAALLGKVDGGRVRWSGDEVSGLGRRALRGRRSHTQFVFQDPAAALSPRMRVGEAVAEPLRIAGRGGEADVAGLLASVGLDEAFADRYPAQLSGGQRQRVVIARSLALGPRLLVLDEPVASLDVSVQAQVLNLLADLQEQRTISYLLIAHDLAVVSSVADRIGVMYLGQIVEEGPAEEVVARPRHPYTQLLIASAPRHDPGERTERIVVAGDPPSPLDLPVGCSFASRCPLAMSTCLTTAPAPRLVDGVTVRCHAA